MKCCLLWVYKVASRMCVSMKMSETSIIDFLACQRMIRSLELKLERLEHGLAMPRDEGATARSKALLKEAECARWQALTGVKQKLSSDGVSVAF